MTNINTHDDDGRWADCSMVDGPDADEGGWRRQGDAEVAAQPRPDDATLVGNGGMSADRVHTGEWNLAYQESTLGPFRAAPHPQQRDGSVTKVSGPPLASEPTDGR